MEHRINKILWNKILLVPYIEIHLMSCVSADINKELVLMGCVIF